MNWKILAFVCITLLFTTMLGWIQLHYQIKFETAVLPQLAPTLAVLCIIFLFKESKFSLQLAMSSQVALKALLALAIPLAIICSTFYIGRLFEPHIKMSNDWQQILPGMLPWIVIGSIGEEIGWRCFMQQNLDRKYNILISSLIVGSIWGLWHVGHYRNGVLFMLGFLMFTISASYMIAWLLKGTQYNLIIATCFHIAINLGFFLFFNTSLTDSILIFINGILWALLAFLVFLLSANS